MKTVALRERNTRNDHDSQSKKPNNRPKNQKKTRCNANVLASPKGDNWDKKQNGQRVKRILQTADDASNLTHFVEKWALPKVFQS